MQRDAGSYRRLLVLGSGRGSAPEVEGRSPPSSRPVLHPRETAQPKRQRGAHTPGPRDAPCFSPFPQEATERTTAATETGRLKRRRWRRPGFLLQRGRCPCGDAGGAGPAPGASARPALQPAPRPEEPSRRAAPSPQGSPLGLLGTRDSSASAAALQSNRPPTTDKLVVSPPKGLPSAERGGEAPAPHGLIRCLQSCGGCRGL